MSSSNSLGDRQIKLYGSSHIIILLLIILCTVHSLFKINILLLLNIKLMNDFMNDTLILLSNDSPP